MSYDLRIAVKVDGCDKFAEIAEPEYSSPAYNLGKMYRVGLRARKILQMFRRNREYRKRR